RVAAREAGERSLRQQGTCGRGGGRTREGARLEFKERNTRSPGRGPVRQLMRERLAPCAILATAALAGCARAELPMGCPPDPNPPQLAAVIPAPGSSAERLSEVVFRFDEVVAERPAGGSLDALVIISPRDGSPRVRWRRNAITVRPRGGWRPATTYSVTL